MRPARLKAPKKKKKKVNKYHKNRHSSIDEINGHACFVIPYVCSGRVQFRFDFCLNIPIVLLLSFLPLFFFFFFLSLSAVIILLIALLFMVNLQSVSIRSLPSSTITTTGQAYQENAGRYFVGIDGVS